MVSGSDFYLGRIHSGKRLEADGAYVPADVSYLRNGSFAGAYWQQGRSMDWRWKQRDGDAIKSDGQSGPPWDAVHGFDFSCRIFVRNVFKRQGNLPLGLYRTPLQRQRTDLPGFCAAVVSDRPFV